MNSEKHSGQKDASQGRSKGQSGVKQGRNRGEARAMKLLRCHTAGVEEAVGCIR